METKFEGPSRQFAGRIVKARQMYPNKCSGYRKELVHLLARGPTPAEWVMELERRDRAATAAAVARHAKAMQAKEDAS